MSRRIDKSWIVFVSHENDAHDRCVDLFRRPDGTHGFEEVRRDVEDARGWFPIGGHAARSFGDEAAALEAALAAVPWLRQALPSGGR